MKLVMSLVCRNEADVVSALLDFHLHHGVDFFIAMDNASDDGTTEILEGRLASVLRIRRSLKRVLQSCSEIRIRDYRMTSSMAKRIEIVSINAFNASKQLGRPTERWEKGMKMPTRRA